MAETAGKRFNISEKSVKNEIYSCPPLETLPNKNTPVDCFCERRPKSLISRWGTQVYVGRLYQADNSKRRVRRLTHQFGTEWQNYINLWQNYINLILLKDNDKWRRNNITFVTNLFPYSPISLFPLPKWPHAQNPCPIRLSARGGGG